MPSSLSLALSLSHTHTHTHSHTVCNHLCTPVQIQLVDEGSSTPSPDTPEAPTSKVLRQKGKLLPWAAPPALGHLPWARRRAQTHCSLHLLHSMLLCVTMSSLFLLRHS